MRLGLSTRKVAELSRTVSAREDRSDFYISHARLVQIENEESIPSIHKLFTLSCIYGVSMQELFWLFFNPQSAEQLHACMPLPNTHLAAFETTPKISVPARLLSTSHATGPEVLSRLMEMWSEAPVSLLQHFSRAKCSYGFIGLSDRTMYPLIPPGSVVQIEECHKIAKALPYRTELDRPVYFLESRTGYLCSWCEIQSGKLFSIPHPLSPCQTQVFDYPTEVEIVGRVTGVALRFGASAMAGLHGQSANQ